MPQPYNYILNLPNPTENVLGAIGITKGITQLEVLRNAQQQQALLSARQAEQNARLQQDLATLGANPSPKAVSTIMVRYPQLSEEFKRTYDVLNEEQQKERVSQASQVYAALNAGKSDIAQSLLETQAEAYRNSGREQEAKTLADLSELTKVSPKTAQASAGLFLASAMGAGKFADTFVKLQKEEREEAISPFKIQQEAVAAKFAEPLATSQLTESQAKAREAVVSSRFAKPLATIKLTQEQARAHQASVAAKFAESIVVKDLEKKGWDIAKIQNDIEVTKANKRIAIAKNQLAKAKDQRERQVLARKIAEAERLRDKELRATMADVESANMNIDNMLNTADRILQTPIGVIEDATGPLESRLPTFFEDTANFEALVENLDAQAFLAQIPNLEGLGALSDAEGKKITAALQNFNLRQSPQQLLNNVKEAQRLLLKSRENIANRYGEPKTIPDTPFAEPTPEEIDDILKQYDFEPTTIEPVKPQVKEITENDLFAAVEQVESGGNPYAVSPVGAIGPMQTMPGTLKDPGFGITPAQNNSISEQRRVGQDYLMAMLDRYNYNLDYALVAYNWGSGNTDKWIARGANKSKLPRETRNYLIKVKGIL